MKPNLHLTLLNGYFEDPCLFIRILREKRALLFDIGNIHALHASDLHKITDVFVTHTHIDHFIGFDTLLRTILRREMPLNIYGPSTILDCVGGKLRGYSWNLIHEYPAMINVFAFSGDKLTHAVFSAKKKFRKETVNSAESSGVLLKDPRFTVKAAVLDHDIPCLAFSIEEEFHVNIDKDRLTKKGFTVGPWLTDFKKLLREKRGKDAKITVNGKPYRTSNLMDIVIITRGQKITYITDCAMTLQNINKAVRLARDSDILYCEAYFLEKDRDRAKERYHLTARTCGSIAKKAGVKKLVAMHFSPKYSDCPEAVLQEAMDAFQK